jgi:hypothetical protein
LSAATRAEVGDLGWLRLAGFRLTFAGLFDAPVGGGPLHAARHVEIECMRFQEVASSYAEAHETRLIDGVCQPQASSAYLAILDSLREVARHSRQIAHRVAATRLAATGQS